MRHLCFSMSGASTLRYALKELGRQEEVLWFCDDLSIGPIDDVCSESRRQWARDYFGADDEEVRWPRQRKFWSDLKTTAFDDVIVWLSRRSTLELSSFFELVSRLPLQSKFRLGDITDLTFAGSLPNCNAFTASSTGILNPQQWHQSFVSVGPVSTDDFAAESLLWSRLKAENSRLRAFVGNQLKSVGEDHFDGKLLSHVSVDWQNTARVVGSCLAYLWELKNTSEVSDLWLLHRVEALVETGVIDSIGDDSPMRGQVRLKRS